MTALSTLGPIQTAVYTLLNADSSGAGNLMSLVTGVFDYVPEGTEKPYVVFAFATEVPRNSHDRYGRTQTITLDVWSDHHGWSEATTIGNRLIRLLDHQQVSISGHTVVSCHFDFAQTLRDPDPDIRHLQIRFRFTTEQDPN